MTSSSAGSRSAVALLYLGFLAAVQGADPGIASTALVSASRDLHMGSTIAIAASINTLMLAATVITTGMMADRWGRRKVLIAGLLVSAVGDLVVAIAPTPLIFIIGRGVCGIGLGAVFGASFAYVRVVAAGRKGGLANALGVYGAAIGAFTVALIFIGSSLVGVDWRVAFIFIPVMCVLSIPLALLLLPQDETPPESTPWDIGGQLLLGVGIIGTLYGISHATNGIATPLTIGPFVIGVALLVLWYLHESRDTPRRFFPVSLFRNRIFLAAILAGLLYNLTTGVVLLAFTNLFQYQLDLSGVRLSLSQLPFLLMAIPAALIIGRMLGSGKLSRRAALVLGTGVIALGAVLFAVTAVSRPNNVWPYLPALMIMGAGTIIPSVPYGGMILEQADEKHYGVVSSARTTIGQYWYSLGLALAAVILDSLTRAHVRSALGPAAEQQLNVYASTGARPSIPDVLEKAARDYGNAFGVLMIVLAVIVIVSGALSWYLLRDDVTQPESAEPAAQT